MVSIRLLMALIREHFTRHSRKELLNSLTRYHFVDSISFEQLDSFLNLEDQVLSELAYGDWGEVVTR